VTTDFGGYEEIKARHTNGGAGVRSPEDGTTDDLLDLGEWDFGEDDEPIPPRGWLLGNVLCRQFLTAVFADGAVGKTALMIMWALSLSTGRSLLGEHVFTRCRVLIICFEDGKDELRRRLTAAMKHHGITKDEIRGHLFVSAINQIDAKLASARAGELIVGKLGEALERTIVRRRADAIFLDPFVKTHAVGENDNVAIDGVVNVLTDLVTKHDISGCTPHHTRKGVPEPGNADTGRGAGAMKDGFRLVYTMTPMSKDEADLYNIGHEERTSLVRMDSGKVNLVRRSATARWFKLVGVLIGNMTALYPNGDEIQTIERWSPPNIFAEVTIAAANQILDRVGTGLKNGSRYSGAAQAQDRAAWRVVIQVCPKLSEKSAKRVIATWIKNGILKDEPYDDPGGCRHPRKGLIVVKRPGEKWDM
jgi:hypothetical protein